LKTETLSLTNKHERNSKNVCQHTLNNDGF
jgi:hypothetical protein